ncbi:hypothetical protein N5P37_005452 [Trichoderma harzianum]|nr:hypothetical protein N5P37_005452 [Trichoderma harzianum]
MIMFRSNKARQSYISCPYDASESRWHPEEQQLVSFLSDLYGEPSWRLMLDQSSPPAYGVFIQAP